MELFEGKLLPFIIEEVDLASSRELIESAVANFLALNVGQCDGVTALVYKNYEVYREAFDPPPPEVKDPSDIWRYIYSSVVFVKQGPEDKDFYIVVSGECEWEIEHGLEMVFKHGDQIVSVGQAGDWWRASACGPACAGCRLTVNGGNLCRELLMSPGAQNIRNKQLVIQVSAPPDSCNYH